MANNSLYDITLGLSIDQAQLTREIQKQDRALKKLYAEAMSHGVDAGMGFFKRGGLQRSFKKASMEMHSIQTKLHQLGRKERQQGLRDEEKALKTRLKLRRKALKDEGKERVKQMKEAAKIEAQYREKALKAAARRKSVGEAFGKGSQAVSGGMGDFLKALKSGDVGGLARSGGRMAGQAGQMGRAVGKQMAGTGIGKTLSKAFGPIVKMLGPIAKLLPMIGAVAGAMVALVKVVLDAEAVTKGFRKQLIRTGGSALDFTDDLRNVKSATDMVSNAFSMVSGPGGDFLMGYGIRTEEAIKALNALRQQGVLVKDLYQSSQQLAKVDDIRTAQQEQLIASMTKVYNIAMLTGMEATEVSQKMGEMMSNLNMSLDTVGDQFSELTQLAATSGYATKKFFGQVLELTAGQSMYNVRLAETAALLQDLQKALGAKDGFDLLQKILGTMSGKDMKTSIKEQAIRGDLKKEKGQALKIMENMARTMMQNPSFKAGILGASAKSGVDVDASSAKALRDSLRKLTLDQRQRLVGAFEQNAKDNKEMMKGFSALKDYLLAVQAGKGGGLEGRASLAAFGGKLGPSFAMMQQLGLLQKARKMGGGEGRSRLLAESFGLDLKQANDLSKYMDMLEGRLKTMTADAKRRKGQAYSEEEQKKDLERYGMAYARDAAGKITGELIGKGGQKIRGMDDAIIANAESFQEKIDPKKIDEQTLLARTIAAATTDMAKILGQISDGILTSIYQSLEKFYRFVFGKSTEQRMTDALDRVTDLYDKQIKARETVMGNLQDEEANLRTLLKEGGLDRKQQATTQANLQAILDRKSAVRDEMSEIRKKRHAAGSTMSRVSTKGADEVFEYFKNDEEDIQKLAGAVYAMAEGKLSFAEFKGAEGNQRVHTGEYRYEEGYEYDGYTMTPTVRQIPVMKKLYDDLNWGAELSIANDDTVDVVEANGVILEKSRKDTADIKKTNQQAADALKEIQRTEQEKDIAGAIGGAASYGTALAGSETVGNFLRHIGSKASKQFFSKARENTEEGAEVKKIVQAILANKDVTEPIKEKLKGYAGIQDGIAHLQEVGGEMQMRIQRINPEDVVSVHKGHQRSGPMSGGGGPQVVNNNFWEGKGAFNSLAAYERAKGAYS